MPLWVTLSLVLFGLLAVIDVSFRYLIQKQYAPIELVLYSLVPTLFAAGVYVLVSRTPLQMPHSLHDYGLFAVIGILSFGAFLMVRYAQKIAPNIGYVNAIMYSSVLVTILATSLLFKDAITTHAFLGATLVIAGIWLITLK